MIKNNKLKIRLKNLNEVYQNIKAGNCLRIYKIYNYQPGFLRYTYGHYPSKVPYTPTKEDFSLLEEYGEKGVDIIILWNWSDFIGYFGKGILEPVSSEGIKSFVNYAHSQGIKVLPYTSPSFIDIKDPNFNKNWVRKIGRLDECYYRLEYACPGCSEWRKFFLNRIENLIERYCFDGIYLDSGFGYPEKGCRNKKGNHIHLFPEKPKEDLLLLYEDFLGEIYHLVKTKNGIVGLFIASDWSIPFSTKYWDYQLIGEGIKGLKRSFQKTKFYSPYVVRYPCWVSLIGKKQKDCIIPELSNVSYFENQIYGGAFAYMEFPWLEGGTWGEDEDIFSLPRVGWKSGWTEWIKGQMKVGIKSAAGTEKITNKDKWYKMIKVYKEITKEGTTTFLEVKGKNKFFKNNISKNVIVSIFVNENIYISITNFSDRKVILYPNGTFQDILNTKIVKEISLKPDEFILLKKIM